MLKTAAVIFSLCCMMSAIICQEIIVEYLVEDGDTLDIFSYQIPAGYSSENPAPILVIFHNWGANHNSNYATYYDERANEYGWFFLSPYGGSGNNYAHQGAQYFFQQEIILLQDNYSIDSDRIYMVGGSMGGAAGAVFANNHLDPSKPMVAATASGSGIHDCERRYWEMDGNNSMIEWFGGTPEEVPFEYHRNSSVFFADSSQSMHYNLQHTPLLLDFSANEDHRYHAEDLYSLLLGYNENMWIETNPEGGHGFTVLDDSLVCDWFSQFELNSDPGNINVNLDQPGRAYWLEAFNQNENDEFIRIIADRTAPETFILTEFTNSDSLLLYQETSTITSVFVNHIHSENFQLGLEWPEDADSLLIYENHHLSGQFYGGSNIYWHQAGADSEYEFVFHYPILDVNGDGIWNILDIVMTVNFIMGNSIPDDYQFNAADLNNDGTINVLDIVQMVNIIMNS